MPTLESIRRFEKALVSLGSEPEVLAERGEEMEEVVPPDESISSDSDLRDLLAAPEAGPPAPEAAPAQVAAEIPAEPPEEAPAEEPLPESPLDALDLDVFGITDEALDQAAAGEGPQAPAGAEEPLEEFTLPEGLFETPQEGEEPPAAEAPLELPAEEPQEEAEAAAQPTAEIEDLSLPDELFEQAAAEPGAIEPMEEAPEFELPEEPAAELPAEETIELPEGPLEEAGAPDVSAFELPDIGVEEPAPASDEIAFDEAEAAPGEAAAPPAAEEQAGGEDFVIDEFKLPGMEAGPAEEEQPEPPRGEPVEAAPPAEGAYRAEGAEAEYTEEEFRAIREALVGLPLNLRVALEEQIGGRKITGEGLRRVLDLLIDGGSASEIARALEKATGVRVSLPRGAEKGTGLEFERERGSLGYLLRNTVVPALRVLVPVAGLLAGMFIAANEYIVKPLDALRGYRRAVRQIEAGQYPAAAQSFNDATHTHPQLYWFHRTALAYRAKAEHGRAADIYERLLGNKTLMGVDPKLASEADRQWDARMRHRLRLRDKFDREAVLAYADMRTHETFEYGGAESLLKSYLDQTGKQGDYRVLIALGDAYVEWGTELPDKYGDAAKAYGKAMAEQKPPTDEPIFRMLRTYARTGNLEQVEKLVQGFAQKKRVRVDAAVYAEAAGTLIDGGRYDVARQVLGRAYDTNKNVPEVYYQFGRLFRWADDGDSEERALDEAISRYDAAEAAGRMPLRQRKLALLARNALGELHARRNEPLKAQAVYTAAIERLERQLADKRLKPAPELGRIYANSGDVHYYHDQDLGRALGLYEKARSMGMVDEQLGYKIGYIQYERGDLERALTELHRVAQKRRDNPSALYALANTLYLRGDHFAAQGYYNQLLKQLESRRQRVQPRIAPADAALRDLMELSMRTYNNLGVNEKKLSMDARNPNRESRALYYLSRSIEFHDQMTRSPDTLARSEARNLGFLNSRAIMYPQAGIELEIYREIPKDLDSYRM